MKIIILILLIVWFTTAQVIIFLKNRQIEEQDHEIEVLNEYIRRLRKLP